MACQKRKFQIDSFPCRVEGWLNVWGLDYDASRQVFRDGNQPLVLWERFFCVLLQDIASLTCHRSEEFADERMRFKNLRRVRLDGSKIEFDKWWGYETLESIKENAFQHECAQASAESFFKTRTMEIRNESLPDLSHSHEFDSGRSQFFRKLFNSSFEKVANTERRGSLPLVSSSLDDAMDSSTSSSRFVSFFTKKGFKSNLKRTKSVTKLDRKRSGSGFLDNDTSSFMGSMKRTMSLGRLTRKRNTSKPTELHDQHVFPCDCVVRTPENHHTWSLISSRIQTSRSHESLLTSPSSMHSIDLTAPDLEIKPLHSSILGQDHCFQVSTTHGSKYISCRTSEERDKWIDSLRRTVQPNQEQCRRADNSLKIWIQEAKNIAPKKRYFCEIHLDKTLYARTSSKAKNDMLFWGEHFEFNNLPSVEFITVNLYREADRKKKKDKNCIVGYVNLPVAEICNRQFVEKWFTAASGTVGKAGKDTKGDMPILRLKARYQTVQILPMDLYQDLVKYLTTDYCMLCESLEPLLGIRDKEEIATTLIHIMQKLNRATNFLSDIVMAEIGRLDNEHLTFRGNSIATKAMEAYMKLVGEKYLQDTLGEFVKSIIEMPDDCEVDPTRVSNNAQLQCHQKNLDMYCNMAWVKIINSYCYFPMELKEVFSNFRERCRQRGKEDFSDNLISASIFLRFLCPAILSPSLFNLTQEYPQERAARNLTLIAKTIQTLANFTKFGGKEEFMTFMNSFVEREASNMKNFLKKISSLDSGNHFLEYDGFIDLGKELSTMHTLLLETLDRAPEATLLKLSKLQSILASITKSLANPDIGTPKSSQRRSQIYDNVSMPSQLDTSPTEVLRDMLRQCGENADDISIFANRKLSQNGCSDISSNNSVPNGNGNNVHYNTYSYSQSYATKSEVSNVSASSHALNQHRVNESWNQMLHAAENVNGEYLDLIPFMDEDTQNSSMELEQNTHGSQMSISQLSTVASSGYQSFGYSQSNSPVDASSHSEYCREITKSPIVHYPMQPLSFSNPMYRHHQNLSRGATPQSIRDASSSDSISSNDEASTVKHRSPVKSEHSSRCLDPLRKLSQLSSSSSSESLSDKQERTAAQSSFTNVSSASSNNVSQFAVGYANPVPAHSSPRQDRSCSFYDTMPQDRGCVRPYQLSHSMDFGCFNQRQGDGIRRTATDSVISQTSTPLHVHSSSSGSLGQFSRDDTLWNSRRHSPNSSVHMGISSVQRKLQEQERIKQEFENEVVTLRSQLDEAQSRLQHAEDRLQFHEQDTKHIIQEWQYRLEESEERMKKQQAEKEDQMKTIISSRLVSIEDELKSEQQEMKKIVSQKQQVIDAQERRIQTLDSANSKLLQALNDLKERYNTTQSRNGLTGPPRPKVKPSELAGFKSSSC